MSIGLGKSLSLAKRTKKKKKGKWENGKRIIDKNEKASASLWQVFLAVLLLSSMNTQPKSALNAVL